MYWAEVAVVIDVTLFLTTDASVAIRSGKNSVTFL